METDRDSQRRKEIEATRIQFVTNIRSNSNDVLVPFLENVSMKKLSRAELDEIIGSDAWNGLESSSKICIEVRQRLFEWISIEDPCFCVGTNTFRSPLIDDYNRWKLKQGEFKTITSTRKNRAGLSRIARETSYEDLVGRGLRFALECAKQPTLMYSVLKSIEKKEKIDCVRFAKCLADKGMQNIILPKKSDSDGFKLLGLFHSWAQKKIPELKDKPQDGYLQCSFFEWTQRVGQWSDNPQYS